LLILKVDFYLLICFLLILQVFNKFNSYLQKFNLDVILNDGWPCSGPLLELAERFAQRLLPAFRSNTGMPYGTVNLKYFLIFILKFFNFLGMDSIILKILLHG